MINNIKIFFKQFNCKHDWRIKGFGTINTQWFTGEERRCCKCKKIEYKTIIK